MGLVYRVHHRGWNIDLALKSPRAEIFSSAGGKDSFIREAETWVELGLHPHIVSCYYVRTIDEIPRIIAEFVEGGSLKDWIEDRRLYEGGKEQALERILDIAIQFAWGLQYAHEQGLVHQDVKPANLLMTPQGVARVSDFGLAKARLAAGEQVGQVGAGSLLVSSGGYTPAYCSPEQAAHAPLSRRTDIWSWALSILEMFTGGVTWLSGVVAAGALEDYLEVGVEEPGLPTMPARLAELLRECFREEPRARPSDMLTIAGLLVEIYQGETGHAYPRELPKAAELRADSLNNKALSLLDLGKNEEALAAWEQALLVDPLHAESTYNQGLIHWRKVLINDDTLLGRLHEVGAAHPGEWSVACLFAQVHLERGDVSAARASLAGIQGSDLNREEVQAVLRQVNSPETSNRRLLRTFEGHTGWVRSVCLSADGRYAFSGSWDKTLKLWDVMSGSCLRTFEGHTGWVYSICLSADGRYALSCSQDKTLKLWDVSSRRCLRTFEGHTRTVSSVILSVDGRYALSGSHDKTLKLWEVATSRCLHTFEGHEHWVESLFLSSDGRHALSGSADMTIKLWDLVSRRCLRTFEGHKYSVTSVCLSADKQFILSGSDDRTLNLWDVSSGACLRTFEGHNSGVTSVTLSADGRYAISSSYDKTLKLWEVASGRCLRTFEGHTNGVYSVCLSADGRYAISGGGDSKLRLWEVLLDQQAPAALFTLSSVQSTQDMLSNQQAFDRALSMAQQSFMDNQVVQAAGGLRQALAQPGFSRAGAALELWRQLYTLLPHRAFREGREIRTFQGHTDLVKTVCLSADGRYALSGGLDHSLKLWDVVSGRCLRTFEGHNSLVSSVCFSADGRFALSGSWDETLKLWEVASGRCLRTFEVHKKYITYIKSVCLSTDGRYALSGSSDKTLKLWEVASGRCLRNFDGHLDEVNSVCLSTDGRYALSGSSDKTLKLWEVASGRCLRTFEGHTNGVYSVCLSADRRYAISGSSDNTLKLWDVASGLCLRTFEGHTKYITSVYLSADDRYAISGSTDRTLRLWEVGNGTCLCTFEGYTREVSSACLSTDGSFVLSSGYYSALKLWALDWELEDKEPADWDEGAQPYLENFLTLHTPYAGTLPQDRQPTEEEITLALTRHGAPSWTEADFQRLLHTLGCAGYGWLRPDGVRKKLEDLASTMKPNRR